MKIRYAHYSFNVDNLGPGFRHVLWVQGCCFRCEGCIAPNYQKSGGIEIEVQELAAKFLEETNKRRSAVSEKTIEGITISGGEPFLQAEALAEFIKILKKSRPWGIIVYTGFTMEELKEKEKNDPSIKRLLDELDLLIDGRYVADLDKGDSLRGSSNQRIWNFTDRYKKQLETVYGKKERHITIRFEDDKMVLIGVPDETDKKRWENMKKYLQMVGGKVI